MSCVLGRGSNPNQLSVDRIIPELGYIKGNIVLCTQKVNLVKNNLTLREMSEWTPGWYGRVIQKFEDDGNTSWSEPEDSQ